MQNAQAPSPESTSVDATRREPAQFRLLPSERQLTLDGRSEPLADTSLFHHRVDAPDDPDTYAAQAELFGWPQAELPLHPLVDGKPNPACVRGVRVKADAHAVDGGKPRVLCECCGLQRCASSKPTNDAERARDLWNGTKRKGGGERIGLRHVVGEADLCILVVTLPPHLRPGGSTQDVKRKVKRWEREAARALEAFLRQRRGDPEAQFYLRANVHPCGEDPQQWKPHLNFLVPAWAFHPSTGRAKRFRPWADVTELRACMAEVQARVFGDAVDAQCHWQFEQGEGGKRHQAVYVPRVFPEWAHMRLRPAGYGLAHSKNRTVLVEALDTLRMKALPSWVTHELRDGLEPAPITGRGPTEADARADFERQLHAHRAICPHCASSTASYPEHRRTMSRAWEVPAPSPPEHPPPSPEPGAWVARFVTSRQQPV